MVCTLKLQIYDYNYDDVLCWGLSKLFDEIQWSEIKSAMLIGHSQNFSLHFGAVVAFQLLALPDI